MNHHFIMPTAESLHFNTSSLGRYGFNNNINTAPGPLLATPSPNQRRDGLECSWPIDSLKSTTLNGELPCREPGGRSFDPQTVYHGPSIGSWSPFESCNPFPSRVRLPHYASTKGINHVIQCSSEPLFGSSLIFHRLTCLLAQGRGVLDEDTRKLSGYTSASGWVAKRPMEH